MRIQTLIFILSGIFPALLFGCTENLNPLAGDEQIDPGRQSINKTIDLSEVSPEVKASFQRLNEWDIEVIDVLECPDKYPGRITSGEANGWIAAHKDKLKELGFVVEWNCDTKAYKLFKVKQ